MNTADDVVLDEPNRLVLSWSGRTSHRIASYLYEWWEKVIPGITPWISSEDIAKGRRWFPELMSQLGKSTTVVICVTPENHKAPWVYYEAGVIAARQKDGVICTVLFGVTMGAIEHTPLAQFQATLAEKDDMWKLARDLNRGLSKGQVAREALREAFETHWPELEATITDALRNSTIATAGAETIDLVSEYGLSSEAQELLGEACQDTGGNILYNEATGGARIYTHGRNSLDPYSARAWAKWKGAIEELERAGLVSHEANGVYRLTREGYTIGDAI